MTQPIKRKLIEVALPLEAINRESAREKSIRQGHPSTLHLWWARRPLAACRAVLFAQLVDDPSSHPDRFPTEALQAEERQRLFGIIERLVVWENSADQGLLREAHGEILASFGGKPPAILDPFAGGGSIPLEARRLGLETYASDLNPVAVLINKALIELPSKWTDQPPTFPGAAESRMGAWIGSSGLAEDVRRYGDSMRIEAERRLGHMYPPAELATGAKAPVIAWIWTRTARCPNPACGIKMPLVRSFWLGKKKGKESFVVPSVGDGRMEFAISTDAKNAPAKELDGTVRRTGAVCLACGSAAPLSYLRSEGKAGRVSHQLMAVVAEGQGRRNYVAPSAEHERAAEMSIPEDFLDDELAHDPRNVMTPGYGMSKHRDLFTSRQLNLLATLSGMVSETRDRVLADGLAKGIDLGLGLEVEGADACAYADTIAIYLAMVLDRIVNENSTLCTWVALPSKEHVRSTFARQSLSMTWDFAEANPWSQSTGSLSQSIVRLAEALERLPHGPSAAVAQQLDAARRSYDGVVVSTDPPYYDNVAYANLADFFYVWLRSTLRGVMPQLFGTTLTPKADELVADQYRHGSQEDAETFFETGFLDVFSAIRASARDDVPITVFYAFKQSESDSAGVASTGWQTLLEGMIRSRWEITATWPIRTERAGRFRDIGANALASSIVLALRPRMEGATATTRKGFLAALKETLPSALRDLQQGSIAPVDLAQAAIGPGMRVFSSYAKVVEADGSDMTVRTALALINQILDEVLSEQEGDFDADTRFCLKWFTQFQWDEGPSGTADTLSRATNTSVAGLDRAGVFQARAGKARLLAIVDLPAAWDPSRDERLSVWEAVMHLVKALSEGGIERAAPLHSSCGQRVDLDAAKELAYLLFATCEKKGWSSSALLFNALGSSWADLQIASRGARPAAQVEMTFDADDEE